MKNFIMTILLGAFVFIALHDFILNSIDNDTQHEMLLLDENRASMDSICDTSKIHHHLHESLLSYGIDECYRLNTISYKTYIDSHYFRNISEFNIFDIYRPPIS